MTGKPSQAEQTFGEMLDEKRAESLASTGALGIGKVLEQQLRAAVLGPAASERASDSYRSKVPRTERRYRL